MRLHIMGSAAAEGWPAVWCRCDACARARRAGGKNVRTRSGALVDGQFKFDLPSDTYLQALRDGIDLSDVTHLLFTHTHRDHYYPGELAFRKPPFAHGYGPLHVWGDQWAIDGVRTQCPDWPEPEQTLHVLTPGELVQVGDAEVMALVAAHYPERICYNYIFRRNGKTLLYGQDSGWFPDAHWEAQQRFRFDIVVIDCTAGGKPAGKVHGNLQTAIDVKARMLAMGTAHAETVFIANHFSHNGGLLHEEIVERLAPHGIQTSYDGMIVEV
ncbi:MAG TPA: MBL fold metallo-hydrolase [Limnochordia bacterium]